MSQLECERCEREYDSESVQVIDLDEERSLCNGCIDALSDNIDYYDWQDLYTEEQHERALSLLTERDEFECVIDSYEDGQIVLHTPYVTSNVVTDFCNHFGFKIISFGPQWEADGIWPCVGRHGDLFEIVLEYNNNCPPPVPTQAIFEENHIEDIDGNDKQF